jgi:FkbH-like protein
VELDARTGVTVRGKRSLVKCVVWDLDDTLWKGILLEDEHVQPVKEVIDTIRELDRRGVLNSIASRNDAATALAKLEEFGIHDLFLYPQISWGPKHAAVAQIASDLNIGTDAIAFVEDQQFERDEVAYSTPGVRCYSPTDVPRLLELPEFTPEVNSEESAQRRHMYRAEQHRTRAESEFAGPKEEFLATLGMIMTVAPAGENDLRRAEELTVRTNQLNTTGRTYSYEELEALRASANYLLLTASLQDRYGSYGKIGLALVELNPNEWRLKLLLMSCRVMARGVGSVMLNHIMRLARQAGAPLVAELVPNDRNRMMLVTLRFAGFEEVGLEDDVLLLRSTQSEAPLSPDYVDLRVVDVTPKAARTRPAPSAFSD